MSIRPHWLAAVLCPLAALAIGAFAADAPAPRPAAAAATAADGWVNISDPITSKITADGKKIGYPGLTAGVVCDGASGDVIMVVPDNGLWKSSDQGKTFARYDDGKVGGRCETSYSLNADPAGNRLACFMLDGKCAFTNDGGKTWTPMKDLGRNWDYAAVDWSGDKVANIFGARHEVGGEAFLSNDGGETWKLLYKDKEFDQSGGVGIFNATTLVRTQKGKGIERSTDSGQTWTKVSDLQPIGRVARVYRGTAYWLTKEGMVVSKDQGATWAKQGAAVDASVGPMFDPADDKHMTIAGPKGIYETKDAGTTWTLVTALPEKFSLQKPGWFANVAWDAKTGTFYASNMGKPTYKWSKGK